MLEAAGYRIEDFTGRRILVTGASRGIAAAIALSLGRAGATVLVNHAPDADEAVGQADAARKLCRAIEDAAGHAEILPGDLTRPGAGAALASAALKHGPIDGLVLSASVQIHAPFLRQTTDDILRQFQINLIANIELIQGLLPGMIAARFGRVLGIGSVQEKAPSPEMPIYAMTKGAMRNLIENLAVSYAGDGVTFNNLAPGLIQTDRNAFRRADAGVWAQTAQNANPMRRAGQPEEMAAPALYLLSRGAAFVTGATLYASGGSHIAAPAPMPAAAQHPPQGMKNATE